MKDKINISNKIRLGKTKKVNNNANLRKRK